MERGLRSSRLTVGPKHIANNQVELSLRDKSVSTLVACDDILDAADALVKDLFTELNKKVQ